ncbi:hypothetical protein CYMTET_39000 [Cymbomonas tetramitiformis]|nr:hypothetical protein CYMTET_39000 [Cymbomonas tetramitiformis]|eukprot:gene18381-21922_t
MCADYNAVLRVCDQEEHRFDESLLCRETQYGVESSRPFEFYYGDGYGFRMGGRLLLYVDEVVLRDDEYAPPPPESYPPPPMDMSSIETFNAHTEDASTDESSVTEETASTNVTDRDSASLSPTYEQFWVMAKDTLEELDASVYRVIKDNLAINMRALGNERFPAISDALFHGVRLYAEILKGVYEGMIYVGYRIAHGNRVAFHVVWEYVDAVLQEYMAMASSLFQIVHFFMSPNIAYDYRSARILCEASNLPNHIMSGTLKISAAVSTAANYPMPGSFHGESVGCNPLRMNCSHGDYLADTMLNLNPVCAMTAVIESSPSATDVAAVVKLFITVVIVLLPFKFPKEDAWDIMWQSLVIVYTSSCVLSYMKNVQNTANTLNVDAYSIFLNDFRLSVNREIKQIIRWSQQQSQTMYKPRTDNAHARIIDVTLDGKYTRMAYA